VVVQKVCDPDTIARLVLRGQTLQKKQEGRRRKRRKWW